MAALWGDALDKYRQITGDDLRDPKSRYYELYQRLEGCSDEGAIFGVLDHEAQAVDEYRHGSEISRRLRPALIPIAKCVLAVIEVGGEAAAGTMCSQWLHGGMHAHCVYRRYREGRRSSLLLRYYCGYALHFSVWRVCP
ncbi:hypothetical protein PENSPDRAFT_67870 [Peniophora sp. CONT]|nr:hypothetical protein PENSPDRAFT_67870 [Peniophora sp. CONT]